MKGGEWEACGGRRETRVKGGVGGLWSEEKDLCEGRRKCGWMGENNLENCTILKGCVCQQECVNCQSSL